MRFLSDPRGPWVAVAISLAFRAVYLAQIQDNPFFGSPVMDEGYHDLWAREIAGGDLAGRLPFFRAPLYPFLLGLAYRLLGPEQPALAWIRGTQLALGALTPWLVSRVARRLVPGIPALAGAAALIVALDGLLLYFEADLLLESLLAPLGTLAALTLLRAGESGSARRWAVCGLVLGLFAITRPNVLLFAPVALGLALGWKGERWDPRPPRWRSASALTGGVCLLVLPVAVANIAIGGDRVLVSSQAGLNFFLGNNPEANGWSATAPSIMRVDWWGGYEDAILIAEGNEGRELRPSEVSSYWLRRGGAYWRDEPVAATALLVRKISFFLSGVEFSNNREIRQFLRDWGPVALPSLGLFFLVMPLAVAGAWRLWLTQGVRGRATVLLVLVYAASIVLFFVTARYRVPLRPLLVVLALEGGRWLVHGLRSGTRPAIAAAAAVAVLGVAVNVNPWTFAYAPTPAQYYQSIANVYHSDGELAAAIDYQLRVLEVEPTYTDGFLNLGTMYVEAGDQAAAVEAFERERGIDPRDGRNLVSLAQALVRLGRLEDGEARYAEARAVGFEDAPALFNHGVLLERLGRPEEAEELYRGSVVADSTFVESWNNLGVAAARRGDVAGAAEHWKRALRIDPDHPRAAANLSRALHELGAGEDRPRKE